MSTDTALASLQEKIDDLNRQAWETRVNDSPKAFQLSQESVTLARSINYAKGLAEGLRSLGFGYVRLFKNDEAAPLLRESLALFKSLNDIKGQAVVYEYLGIIERNWGNLGASLELLLKGYALIQQVGSLEIEVTCCYQIGVTYKHLGNHENALDYLYRSLSIAKKANNALMEAYSINIIGSIYFDNGDYNDALDCYQRGLVIRRESHDKWGEAGSLDNIGFTYLKLNDLDKATDYCKQSLKITQSTGDKKGEANTLLHLAEIFRQAGDIRQASTFSDESLEIRKARGDRRGEAEVLLFLADLHKKGEETEDHQIFEWLSGALKIADEIKAQDLLSKAHYNLHEYHTQKGDHKESLIQLEAHLQIEKELHKNTINQKISNLEISHKAEVISQRNKELIDLNEKIEKANAELKFEASLERVRAVAMGMKEPADMINVCRMISDQLLQLGFKEIRNVQTAIIYPQKHEYLNYQYFTPYDKESIETIDYRLHPDVLEFSNLMLSSPDAYYTKTFEGEELKVWREYRKQTNQLPDPKLDATNSSHYYFYSIGSGALGVTTYAPLKEEQINVFKRFRNVFELAYRRFIDIEKALAQAREAQIQLALERVRARTMAMHHSEELSEVVKLLYQECDKLKINNESTDIEIGLIDEETGIASIWAHFYLSDGTISTFKFPLTRFEEVNEEFKKWKATPVEKRHELFFTTEFSAEQWQRFANIAEELPELSEIFRPLFEAKITKWVTHNAYFSHGILTLQGTKAYSQETQEILKRFAKVFEQTYTRFLDLKKAEAQAKEAKIEAALERVRATSMAMHHSDDLITVINVVQEQLLGLGFHFHGANFVTDYSEKGYTMWLASPGESFPYKIYVPQVGLKYFEAVNAAIEKGLDFATYTLSFEEKNIYFKNLFENSLVRNTSEEGKRIVFESKGMAASVVLLDKIRLNLMNLDMIPYTDEENDTLKRFGYVFEQSYTRFLDLQKAEAQAREAQIETGLERVRSKTMAMHKSEEVTGVAVSLNEELLKLGFEGGSTIIIMDKETGGTEQWTGFSADKSLKSCYVPYFKHPCHDAQLNAWKKGEEFLVYTLAGDEKRSLDEHYFATGYKVFPESDKRWMRQMESVTFSHAFMKYGAIHWGPNHLTEDQLRILQRFSKVFEQSYTRFLDLQKAEAQARESQIQLAMERVRARTMAMQRSEELAEVATVLFQQVKALGVSQWVCGFSIWETGDKEFTWYPGSPDGEILAPCKVPLTEHPVFISYDESRRRGDELFVYEKEGEFQVDHYRYMMSVPGMRKLLQNMLDAGLSIPSFQIDHIANFSHGNLIFITYEHVPEMHDIFKRFAKVFDQTYTRFLDLQKAEAQAREAQIEAALERVRSRTMGMHKSDELREVVAVLFTQLQHIGFDIKFCSIALIDKINSTVEFWLSGFSQEILPESYHVPNLDHPFYQNFQSTFRQGVPYHVFELAGAEKRSYDKLWFTLTDFKNLPDPVKRPMMEMERVVLSCAFTKNGMIQIGGFEPLSETDATIIQRFAKVFEQTYTRFLDLQKAEAQAREAQIEVALERIRARAMAMHSSNELMDVANILREQMGLLGQPDLETSVVNLFEEDSELIFSWNASRVPGSSEKIMSSTTSFPKNSSELAREMMSLYHSGEKEYTLEAAGLKLMEFLNILIKANPRVADYIGNNPPEKVFYHFTTFTGGNLLTVSYQPPSEETKSLQRRAASVFDMAYRRYRDLKRAEAQAREAQIEAAVEKVRSRSLAMHKSDELQEVVHTVFERLKDLNVDFYTAIIILFKEGSKDIIWWLESKANQQYSRISVPYTPIAYFKDLFDKRESGGDMLSKFYPFDEKNKLFHHLFANTDFKDVPETQKQFLLGAEFVTISVALAGNTGIHISSYSKKSFSDQDNQIIKRFANVFDQAYTRFHDLQKAEAQAREAKIEAALERVRSRTMAMHKSDELAEVATVLFEQMSLLDNTPERFNIRIANEAEGVFEFWATDQEGHLVNKFFRAAFDKSPVVLQMYTSWKAKEKILIQDLHGDQLSEWVHYIRDELGVPFNTKTLKEHRFLSSVFFSHGMIGITTNDTPSPATLQLIERFAKVFEQTYTRFLDLQKAEAQARDAQIEVALERVRAKVMAMTNSNDLNETSLVFGEQLGKLGIDWQFSYFWLIEESKNENTFWITWPDNKTSLTTYTLAEAEEYFNDCLISWRTGVKIHDNYVPPEGVQEWLDTFQRIADDAGGEAKKIMVPPTFANGVYYYDAMMKYGSFGICINKPATDEEKKIQCRFAVEFERAYTRFLDLKQAEAQAREARIEVALERVRAKAMAMHKSDDLKMAVATVFEELDKLNIGILRCGIAIMDKEKPRADVWITVKSEQTNTIQVSGDESLDYHPLLRGAYDGWVKQEDFSYVLQGEDLLNYYRDVASIKYQLPVSTPFDKEKVDQQQYYFNAVFQDGSLFAFMETAFTDEAKTVMKRFANVFNLTYKRFLDLQKAEAQAREAQIELGLERVRARAMAMQKSAELKELIATVSTELSKLDIVLDRSFIMTYDIKTLGTTWWMANPETSSDPIGLYVKYHEQAPYLAFLKAWQDRVVKWQYLLEGSVKKTWDEFLFVETELSRLPGFVIDNMRGNDKVYLSASFNNFGCLTLATLEPLSDEQFEIMLRFAKVFDLTYTRFNDLKQAEAQAREAKIEAGLERVRARALAMQEPEELKDVAHILRTEMGLLGVEELETCSIYINDESAEKAECWYALKDVRSEEKKLVNDHFALNLNDTWVGREMLRFYQSPQKKISIVMQGENRKEWIRYCEEHSAPFRGYYGETIPDRTYHLYKFSHGAIGAAAAGDISEESWRMLSRAASVFTLAYSRFKDLTQARTDLIKLKEEKKRAEEALTELQATQKQLIQSEKMASLGELTAGIAHEIQNPLNFVNNFSDVSNELLEEMKQELATGNTQQAIEIVNGVKENLEKILHHGKRADAIVKGMLQHSRSSSGQKELTDINTLAEEYLRLAYHGLRAKDKFFNAKFETDLDPSLDKINVVPQEIGRVILNLINNAFYAVTEKKKSLPASPKGVHGKTFNDYEPTVTVTTKRLGPPPAGGDRGSVEIKVADNGNGIPQKALDKIFQPFFTTKPTGQGTGLGLSLSYDIITKGHDGEITVKTKEGEGSEFTISLPMN